MQYIKLQAACLVVVLYILGIYLKDSFNKNIKCNKLYDILIGIAPWSIFFDLLTAYTVNKLDSVPDTVNLILHCLFFLLMNLNIVIYFIYMLDLTIGLPKRYKKKRKWALILAPGIIASIIIILFMPELEYKTGDITNYSFGISVITTYLSVVYHFTVTFIIVLFKSKTIEKRKYNGILSLLLVVLILLIIQTTIPQSLVSALFPTLYVVGFYVLFENPAVRRVQHYNDVMITNFATLVESRDNSTGGHIKRTKGYVNIILKEMKHDPKYGRIMTKDYIKNVLMAAPMHDIGKITTPDSILQKPGKLTNEEFEIMKLHAPNGGDIIKETLKDLGDKEFEAICYEVARFHHEKWNGRGYPEGLKEEEIPLHARIMAIADVFDAVSAKRCYRDALPIDECFKIIEEGIGRDFDPNLAKLFLNRKDLILKLYNKEKDKE